MWQQIEIKSCLVQISGTYLFSAVTRIATGTTITYNWTVIVREPMPRYFFDELNCDTSRTKNARALCTNNHFVTRPLPVSYFTVKV